MTKVFLLLSKIPWPGKSSLKAYYFAVQNTEWRNATPSFCNILGWISHIHATNLKSSLEKRLVACMWLGLNLNNLVSLVIWGHQSWIFLLWVPTVEPRTHFHRFLQTLPSSVNHLLHFSSELVRLHFILFAQNCGPSDKVSIVISQLTNFSEFIDAFGIVLLFVYKLISVHDELCYGCQLTKKFRCWQHKQCDYLTWWTLLWLSADKEI